jgi:uncharacterized protein YggE
MKFASFFAPLFALSLSLAPLHSQQPPAVQAGAIIPQIVTTGMGETQITPDRARIDIAVETRGATAAAAAAENARISTAVLARLRTLGLTDQQLGTWGYNVNAEYDYSRDGGRPRIIGYIARNTVRAEVRRVEQTGAIIDAGIGAGANNIGGLHFYSSNVDAARQTALTQAVGRARADAEAMARAAGGRLGGLLELSSSFYSPPPPMPYMARDMALSQAAETPINPGEQTVTVNVTARWRYVGP